MTITCSACSFVYDLGFHATNSTNITFKIESNCPNCGIYHSISGTFDFDENGNPTPVIDSQKKRTKTPKKISYAEFHFMQAVRFDLAGQIIQQQMVNTNNPGLIYPASTVDTFSIELYLKLLLLKIQKYNWVGKKVHTLLSLYEKLTDESKIELEKLYESEIVPIREMQEIIKKHQDIGYKRKYSLLELLEEANETFVVYRYLHEPEMRKKHKGIWAMPLKLVFRRYIIQHHPEWKIHQAAFMVW